MATISIKKLLADFLPFSGAPYGNSMNVKGSLVTSAAGVLVNGDSSAAIAAGDKVRIGILPAGMELHSALALISDAFRATSTFKIGFEYVDGVDSASVPQDDDYFYAALAADAAARTSATNTGVRPVVLPKDAYLIVTNQVVAQNVVGVLDVIVTGAMVGQP